MYSLLFYANFLKSGGTQRERVPKSVWTGERWVTRIPSPPLHTTQTAQWDSNALFWAFSPAFNQTMYAHMTLSILLPLQIADWRDPCCDTISWLNASRSAFGFWHLPRQDVLPSLYLYIYIPIHIFIYLDMHLYTYLYIQISMHTLIHRYIYVYTHIYIPMHIFIYLYIYLYSHIYIYTLYKYICIPIHICTYLYMSI